MKKNIIRILTITVCLMICAVFTGVLLAYTRPMEDKIYNLSLTWENSEAVPDDWVYDQKGWSVFTQEGDTVTELVPDGYGGFSGLSYPGQTFYFSRTMTEDLDAPTLRLGAVSRGVAVFLDGKLLYTDCFGEDCRIGYLRLPMLKWDRTEPVVVTLPADYVGKTLTIAQSTSPYGSELQNDELRVWPCTAVLYCGYAYESSLISESFRAALPAAGLFLTGVFLMGFFVWQVFHGGVDIALLCAAMVSFLWMTSLMALASFSYNFFGPMPVDVVYLCRDISRSALLAFLTSRCTGKRRIVLGLLTGLQVALSVLYVACQLTGRLPPDSIWLDSFGVLSLLVALVLGFLEWRREDSFFYGLFCAFTAAGVLVYIVAICIMPSLRPDVQWLASLVSYFRRHLTSLIMAAAIAGGGTAGIRRELERRIEARLLAQRHSLAQASYESMREHHEQVMILRHDIAKHLRLLRQMTGERNVADYLDEIMGENEKIRSVIQSGNEMLDIILNGKLAAAADAGIRVELARIQAPPVLPLSSMELCSLFMNVMDNAVTAALSSGAEPPYILLDLHVKGDFFVFSCKNSAAWDQPGRTDKNEAVPQHGLGLKIIRNISERYGNLMETERGDDYYKVILAIPLSGPDAGQPSR